MIPRGGPSGAKQLGRAAIKLIVAISLMAEAVAMAQDRPQQPPGTISSSTNQNREAGTGASLLALDPIPGQRMLVARFSEKLFNRLISRTIHHQTGVRNFVLGADVTGVAWTSGKIALAFEQSGEPLTVGLVFSGTSTADTVARKGPVQIFSQTRTRFTASKRVQLDPANGFTTLPARISSRTTRTVRGIQANACGLRGCLIRHIARRRHGALSPQILAIADRNARDRIATSFDARAVQAVERFNRLLRLVQPVSQAIQDASDRSFRLSSSEGSLEFWSWPDQITVAGEIRRLGEEQDLRTLITLPELDQNVPLQITVLPALSREEQVELADLWEAIDTIILEFREKAAEQSGQFGPDTALEEGPVLTLSHRTDGDYSIISVQ